MLEPVLICERRLRPSEVKKEPMISLNPHGRVTLIEDSNTRIILWESAAIPEYMVEPYYPDGPPQLPGSTTVTLNSCPPPSIVVVKSFAT